MEGVFYIRPFIGFCNLTRKGNSKMYSGNRAYLNARIPVELLNRLHERAHDLQITKSMLVRSILEMCLLTRDELTERLNRERQIQNWIRAGMPEGQDPEATWNPDHINHRKI
jgi:hypothetical protein